MKWTVPLARGRTWEFDRVQVVGILNATPDSFSDGGALASPDAVFDRVQEMLAQGVDAFDVGGESTRPGHEPVAADEEIRRVVPVIRAIRDAAPEAIISIDTSKAEVADAALQAGADWINDVSALGDPLMARVASAAGCAVVLMRHEPLVGEALESCTDQLRFLTERAAEGGISPTCIVLDPGLGFGDRPGPGPRDNLALLQGIGAYSNGHPVFIGHSRKRFVVALANESCIDVDAMTASLCRTAAEAGAAMVRVHNVAAARAALD